VLDGFFMKTSWLVGELGTLMNGKRDVRSCVGSDEVELANDQAVVPVFFSWGTLGVGM